MGGIRIDTDARVLNEAGAPIPGLYAAGASTGGIEGGPAIGYIGGLSKSAVFGFRAAEHAAGTKQ
jgi:fumarate reductase flavoprotein subunit